MNAPNLILYHGGGCFDGFCAAWLAHRAFPNAEYRAAQYGEDPPGVTGRDVWILDFSYKRPVLLDMKAKAASLLAFDHHKTAQADLAGLDFCTFDMAKSGARLTFDYLCRHDVATGGATSDGVPWLVAYTEDRDLWLHKLPLTKEVNAGLRALPMDFDAWDLLHANPDAQRTLATEGAAILRYQRKLVESHVSHAQEVEIMGHKVLCVNCTTPDLQSEVAGELAEGRPFGACWFEADSNERVYSLRSRDGGVDVSEVAKAHGGGGHRNAAGFRMLATGALGTFSKGRLDPSDEGDLKIGIAADKAARIVRMDFGKPVAWLGLPQQQAMEFAEKIQYHARRLG
jgi:oligoribonuclease NrnB/cAMP/cGMP phosphodiesterase (DHH superfamily)